VPVLSMVIKILRGEDAILSVRPGETGVPDPSDLVLQIFLHQTIPPRFGGDCLL